MERKSVVRSGPVSPSECFSCGEAVRPPAVHLEGSTGSISLHPACGERLGVGAIGDARIARGVGADSGRADLRVVDGGRR